MGRTRPHHTLILLHGESSKRPRNFGTAHADGVYLLSGGEEAVLVVVWQLETGHPTKVRVREDMASFASVTPAPKIYFSGIFGILRPKAGQAQLKGAAVARDYER
ncbi:hypothetical protein BC936DRAFT_149437 [Jimgerdemannia flammicorona]|uniref:Uncharacterized protein n=1 Tax=Jimgerdemannia flammicorona TaxID=994334 RepID=A0A433DK32_9FUNG|nr:hypothetical protein BC936DRAFT_149437 [Jimgerdemannia flammicorona]